MLCLEVANALAAADTPWNPVRDVWWHAAVPMQVREREAGAGGAARGGGQGAGARLLGEGWSVSRTGGAGGSGADVHALLVSYAHTPAPTPRPQSAECEPTWLDSEDRSFLLYTSGSTGKPKGVVHCVGGYMVGVGVSCRYLYDMRPGDVVFTTADW